MRALILAAGEGLRLRPLTKDKPKALVKLLEKPLILRQISVLKSAGISNIGIATGYLAGELKKLGLNCYNNPNYENTNMVNTLFKAKEFLKKGEDLIVSYGDIVYQLENLRKIIMSKAEISVVVDKEWLRYWKIRFNNPLSDAESLILDDNCLIKELGFKTNDYNNIHGQYIGLIKIRGDKIDDFIDFYENLKRERISNLREFDNMYLTDFIQNLINSEWEVKAVCIRAGWLEIDSLSDLNLYENLAKNNKLDTFCRLD